jgi:hypothetical protein
LGCATLVAIVAGLARPACAEGEPPSHTSASTARPESQPSDADAIRAFATGVAIAGASLAAGGAVFANNRSQTVRVDAIYLADGGLTLAPFVAHAMASGWKDGLTAALPTAASSAAMVGFLTYEPHAVNRGEVLSQYTFSILLAASVFSSIFEVTRVLPLQPSESQRVSIAPSVGPREFGLRVGGRL